MFEVAVTFNLVSKDINCGMYISQQMENTEIHEDALFVEEKELEKAWPMLERAASLW